MSFLIDGAQIGLATIPLNRLITIGYSPSLGTDLVSVDYLQAVIAGLEPKADCVAATTGNIANLSSAGSTFDGVSMSNGQRLLVHIQTNQVENGVYIWATGGILTRATDFDDSPTNNVQKGTFVHVEGGTTYGGSGWFVSNTGTGLGGDVIVGTDNIVFSKYFQSPASSLLTSNNTWTGTNTFSNTVTMGDFTISNDRITSSNDIWIQPDSSVPHIHLMDQVSDPVGSVIFDSNLSNAGSFEIIDPVNTPYLRATHRDGSASTHFYNVEIPVARDNSDADYLMSFRFQRVGAGDIITRPNLLRIQRGINDLINVSREGSISFGALGNGTVVLPSDAETNTGALRYNTGNVEVYDGGWNAIGVSSTFLSLSDVNATQQTNGLLYWDGNSVESNTQVKFASSFGGEISITDGTKTLTLSHNFVDIGDGAQSGVRVIVDSYVSGLSTLAGPTVQLNPRTSSHSGQIVAIIENSGGDTGTNPVMTFVSRKLLSENSGEIQTRPLFGWANRLDPPFTIIEPLTYNWDFKSSNIKFTGTGTIQLPATPASTVDGSLRWDSIDKLQYYEASAGGWINVSSAGGAQISGTPLDNQVAVWTNSNTLEGLSWFTIDPVLSAIQTASATHETEVRPSIINIKDTNDNNTNQLQPDGFTSFIQQSSTIVFQHLVDITNANDIGINPVFRYKFRTQLPTGPISTRPLMTWENNSTIVATLDNNGDLTLDGALTLGGDILVDAAGTFDLGDATNYLNLIHAQNYHFIDTTSGIIVTGSKEVEFRVDNISTTFAGVFFNMLVTDSGSVPIYRFNAQTNAGGSIATRDLLTIENDSVVKITVDKDGDISFANPTQTIAGIETQNLLDKTVNETITGEWTFNEADSAKIIMSAGASDIPTLELVHDAIPGVGNVIVEINFKAQDSLANVTTFAQITSSIIDPTDGSEKGDIKLRVNDGGTFRTMIEVEGDAGGKIGVFGVTPVVRQTTSSQTPAAFVANSSGIADDSATWGGYTVGDAIAILQAYGWLT